MATPTYLDTLTGEQFKQLIEQFTQDGKIDTIPELIEFLSDIPEGQLLSEYVAAHGGQAAEDIIKRNAEEAYDLENERLFLFGRPKEEEPEEEPEEEEEAEP